MIYADYAATTPVDPRVAASMQPYLSTSFYNPSSLYPAARGVRQAVEQARGQVAQLIGAVDGRVIFTSGGTESDNLALIGTALHPDNRKRHLITSAVEHHAVLESCAWLERMGFRVTYLPVDQYGRVCPDDLRQAIDADTFLVSVMWVNNELGTIQDVQTLADIAHAAGAWFHTDAVQAMTTQEVSVQGADLLTLSSHKIYGPKGAGALYVLHVSFADLEAEGLLFWLAKAGVAASMGSACDTERVEPSHVVCAIGLPDAYARGCLRLSFGRGLDDSQIDALAERIAAAVQRMRR